MINRITAATNGLWAASGLIVATLSIFALLYRNHDLTRDARVLCFGAAVAGMSSAIHRLYWNLAIWTRDGGVYADWSADLRWIPALAVVGVCLGTWIAVAPYAEELLGHFWIYTIAGWMLSFAVVSWFLA